MFSITGRRLGLQHWRKGRHNRSVLSHVSSISQFTGTNDANWHTAYFGLKDLPRELSAFELQAFFTFSRDEREVIDARYGVTYKLGLTLHIKFLRLSGSALVSYSSCLHHCGRIWAKSLVARIQSSYEYMNYLQVVQVIVRTPGGSKPNLRKLPGKQACIGVA